MLVCEIDSSGLVEVDIEGVSNPINLEISQCRRLLIDVLVPADMLSQWRLWYYATIGFLIQAVLAGCIFFVPLIIDSMFTGKFSGAASVQCGKLLDMTSTTGCR